MLDATGSIGLEKGHNLSDISTFSSCKGLFGLTGASFIAYNDEPKNNVKSFYMDINTHINKKLTGPYHTIGSLYYVLIFIIYLMALLNSNKSKFLKDNYKSLIYPLKINHCFVHIAK